MLRAQYYSRSLVQFDCKLFQQKKRKKQSIEDKSLKVLGFFRGRSHQLAVWSLSSRKMLINKFSTYMEVNGYTRVVCAHCTCVCVQRLCIGCSIFISKCICNHLWTTFRPAEKKHDAIICFDNRSQWMIITTSLLASSPVAHSILSLTHTLTLFPVLDSRLTFCDYITFVMQQSFHPKNSKKRNYSVFFAAYCWTALDHYLS